MAGDGDTTDSPGPPIDAESLAIGATVAIDSGEMPMPIGLVTALDSGLGVATVAVRGTADAGGHAASRAVPFGRLRQAAE